MSRFPLVAVAVLLSIPTQVAACCCGGSRTAVEARSAPLIVRARILQIEYRDAQATDAYHNSFVPQLRVHADVSRSWRERISSELTLFTALKWNCGYHFAAGHEYYIPLYKNDAGEWIAWLCSGVQPVHEARDLTDSLGLGYRPEHPTLFSPAIADRATLLEWGIAYSASALLILAGLAWSLYGRRRLG